MNLDWTDLRLIASVVSGSLLAALFSTANSWRTRLTCVAAGVFCAYFGTEPLIAWAGERYTSSGWPYIIAALLALAGDRLVRRFFQLIDSVAIPLPWKGK